MAAAFLAFWLMVVLLLWFVVVSALNWLDLQKLVGNCMLPQLLVELAA